MKSRKIREVDFAKSGLSAGWCPISLSIIFNSCGWAWEDYWGTFTFSHGNPGNLALPLHFVKNLVTNPEGRFLTVSTISDSSPSTVSSFLGV